MNRRGFDVNVEIKQLQKCHVIGSHSVSFFLYLTENRAILTTQFYLPPAFTSQILLVYSCLSSRGLLK